jgi:hypothetical protein
MHTKDARTASETEQRIYALNAWRETPFFTNRERAALEWTEDCHECHRPLHGIARRPSSLPCRSPRSQTRRN